MPQKCIFCAHLIDDETWTPHTTRCTHSCPTDAMATYLVEPEEMEKMIDAEDLQAYLPEHGTKPHTLYKNLYKYTKNFITAGVLVDGDCYEGATVTLHSNEGGIVCNLSGAGVADCHDTADLGPAPRTSSASSSSTASRTASTSSRWTPTARSTPPPSPSTASPEPGVHRAVAGGGGTRQ